MIVKNRLLNFSDTYIYQDSDYFKFSLDSLLLANFVTINLGDKNILDIATGNAPIPMFLSFRTKANIVGVELQKEVFELGVLSIKENKLDKQISLINDDIKHYVEEQSGDLFDVITCNPPYFKTNNADFENNNIVKSLARHEKTLNLEDIMLVSKKLLKTNGKLALVHRTERFIEIIMMMKKYNIEPKKVRFIYPKSGKNSDLVLIEGVKNGKSGMKLLPPLYVYDDTGNYCAEVEMMFGE